MASASSPLSAPLALRAIVKSVQSGDTLVLRNRAAPPPGQPAQERILHLAHIQAPRTGNRDRQDEAYALASRDFLRTMVVGREVSFEITYTIPANPTTGAPQMEFGDVVLARATPADPSTVEHIDLAYAAVQAGCAKVRESRNVEQEGASEQSRKALLREAEEAAQSAEKGLWAPDPSRPTVNWNFPEDPDAFLNENGKGKKLDACIEAVNNGSTVRARLQVSPDTYQIVNIA